MRHTPTLWIIGNMPSVIECQERGDWVMLNSDDWFHAKACVNAFHGSGLEPEQIKVGMVGRLLDAMREVVEKKHEDGHFYSVNAIRALLTEIDK